MSNFDVFTYNPFGIKEATFNISYKYTFPSGIVVNSF